MGTAELLAQSREHQRAELLEAARKMHAITKRLLHASPKLAEENEAHAKRLEDMAAKIAITEVHTHAKEG